MRVVALLAVLVLLSGCTWVRQELAPIPPAQTEPVPKPEPARPAKPRPRVERPATPAPAQTEPQTDAPPPIDYESRCRTMASNRADDAKQLGASPADQAKVQNDAYRNCMAESVK